MPIVDDATGVNASERYLHRLARATCLSLWSHPNVFRSQGAKGGARDGKELCDLLVVFAPHVLIFSDKTAAFGSSNDLRLDWSRWYRRAVFEAAEQVWQAERWIRSYPDRIFINRRCTERLPFPLPPASEMQVHRIVAAHGVANECRAYLGGSGSLMLMPDLSSATQCSPEHCMPFVVGDVDPSKGFVHVLDDTSLRIVLSTLDTIGDFVGYLTRKERFIRSGRLSVAAGEEDLLAYYLKDTDEEGQHDFILDPRATTLAIDEGLWQEFARSDTRPRQLDANEVSYAWDQIIEKTTHFALQGTSYWTSPPGLLNQEQLLRLFARESRTRRRALSQALLSLIAVSEPGKRHTRVLLPLKPGDPHYVFVVVDARPDKPYDEYRLVRRNLLDACCRAVKVRYPDAVAAIGFATEGRSATTRSEDLVYFDFTEWNDELQNDAEAIRDRLGLLVDTHEYSVSTKEYPDPPARDEQRVRPPSGSERNLPCPCGSRRKWKRCCGART